LEKRIGRGERKEGRTWGDADQVECLFLYCRLYVLEKEKEEKRKERGRKREDLLDSRA